MYCNFCANNSRIQWIQHTQVESYGLRKRSYISVTVYGRLRPYTEKHGAKRRPYTEAVYDDNKRPYLYP